jgi:hypothetical protein
MICIIKGSKITFKGAHIKVTNTHGFITFDFVKLASTKSQYELWLVTFFRNVVESAFGEDVVDYSVCY